MAKQILLKDQNGNHAVIQEGESADLVGVFSDLASTPTTLTIDDILTITLTLYAGTTTINSRSAQSVKNENDGTLASDGTLTVKLGPLDAIIVGAATAGQMESHIARFTWTWNDGTVRTGREEYLFNVEKLAEPT